MANNKDRKNNEVLNAVNYETSKEYKDLKRFHATLISN